MEPVNTVNGTGPKRKGRKVPELPEFTFPTSGYTVKIRRVGPFTMNELRTSLRKQKPMPQAPMVKVPDGENPHTGETIYRLEANPADPDYKRDLQEYEDWLRQEAGERFIAMMLDYCVVLSDYDIDDIATEAADKRAMLLALGIDSATIGEMSDRDVFVRHVLIGSGEDLGALQDFIMARSQPTEEAVQAHIETFQGDVPG